MTTTQRQRLSLGLKIAAYVLAAYSVLLFLDSEKGNDQAAIVLIFSAVAIRLVARLFDREGSTNEDPKA